MDEQLRKDVKRKQQVELLARDFGLARDLWDKYSLVNFHVVPGTELGYRTALEFLMIPPELKLPDELFQSEAEIEAWYDRQPALHHFLTFVGDCGRGKTHLALGLGIWQIGNLESSAIYWQVPALLSTLRRSFESNSKVSYGGVTAKCKSTELLILDDLGMQKDSDWVLEQLDSLVDYRYVNELQTVFTTNLKPSRLPPRIASRLREGEVVTLTGEDYRLLKAKRRAERREIHAEVEHIIRQR
jgi:DNA replication protein DnaC